ncbi:bifunctional 4-hydroxy-2-oxoglutarate aldolase/2-dehydro-3-deoxy-phosphogluconate aldolase [Ferviditalea candida]|uniref:Bifunctional 4-hydroxy-2-oxoglutarate aldolase/2-dehydro-3-deoxy-phosphogluconate aldolase n=1 Tax=Ferviditalea candida TaxID=3108399 RepID=A0ABU5ZG74_9BACL|nr:bifunctional 4-hydroxy-2-oxoglutarate aldolase/2-dehydro-3-deoxy-phosphogluconate aldolase [Paenibacillaceae bacterium T2]
MSANLLKVLSEEKIVAIIRGIEADAGDATAEALADGGIRLLEVTMNTEGALRMISRFRENYGSRMRVGAGTVLNLKMAKKAVQAGAEYIISPNLDERVIEYALRKGVDVWPGTMTPTEIVRAFEAGAQAVKVFPMGSLGINYLKEIRAPLDHIPMIATGGVNLQNIGDFLNTGILGVGLGSNLVNKKLIAERRFAELTELARSFVEAAQGGKRA